MRIISGSRRGHKLLEFDGMDIRPTTDRVRENVFNLICDYVYDSNVLDLFGGSGALSFEALSRGARFSTICDIDQKSLDIVKKNAEKLDLLEYIKMNHIGFDKFLETTNDKFDIIFLDPPYNKGFIKPCIDLIIKNEILTEDGIIVLESDSIDEHGEFLPLTIKKQKKYGRSYVTVYTRGE